MPKRKRETSLSDLTDDEIENLWASKTLGGSSPESILNTLYFNNAVHFGVCDRNRHREIKWGDVELKEDSDGHEYLELKKHTSPQKKGDQSDSNHSLPKMCSVPEKQRCPVEMYKKYKSLRPENYCSQDSPFYVATNVNYSSKGSVWLKKQPVGVNKLEDIMKRLLNNQLSSPPNRVPDQKRTLKRRGSKARKDSDVNPEESTSKSSSFHHNQTDNSTEGKMTRSAALLLAKACESVGCIGGGTGFRVGSKYIMTASHVVKTALGNDVFKPVTRESIQIQLNLQGLEIDFTVDKNKNMIPLRKIVFYRDRSEQVDGDFLDVTIAELDTDFDLPKPLDDFYDDQGTDTQKNFSFLGHDNLSEDVEFGFSWTLVDGPNLRTIASELDEMSKLGPSDESFFNKCGKDPRRVQLQGPFRGGGSGSPGVIVSDRKVKVFTILTHGFFDNSNVPNRLQIQEGTRMLCLKEILKQENGSLCQDIFGGWDSHRSEESSMDITK